MGGRGGAGMGGRGAGMRGRGRGAGWGGGFNYGGPPSDCENRLYFLHAWFVNFFKIHFNAAFSDVDYGGYGDYGYGGGYCGPIQIAAGLCGGYGY